MWLRAMFTPSLRMLGVVDGLGTPDLRAGSTAQGWSGFSDSACGERRSALTRASLELGPTIRSLSAITRRATQLRCKIHEAFPAAYLGLNWTGNRYPAPRTFRSSTTASNIMS